MSRVALRPMLPSDGAALAALFRASIAELAAEDYDEDQREAWVARADDEAAFVRRLSGQLTLVATRDDAPAGFASLAGTEVLDMLYVDPEHARAGVASALVDALVRLAAARGGRTLRVDASDTARAFFAARGFVATMRNTVMVGDQWLGNTTMERKLEEASRAR